MPRKKFHVLAQHLQEVMEDSLFKMVDARVKELTKTQVPIYVAQGLIMERQQSQADVAKMIVDVIQQERENLRAEISSQINNANTNHIPSQVDSSVRFYMSSHILHVHSTQASQASASNTPCQTSTIRLRDHDDPHDDAHPEGENSAKSQKTSEHGIYVFGESSSGQVNESEPGPSTSDEAKLHKVVDEMLRQQCTLGDERQYHIDQMQNFLKNDIVWESKSGSEKIVLSLHKFPAVIFPDDEIEERTSRWIFYIKRQKEPGKLKEEIYSNSKIVQIIKTYGELGHEHKFITEIIAKRANGSIVSITKPDYKNLNKNDLKDMYLLIINGKVDDYIETGLLWSLPVFIRSTVIWERVHDFQLGVESYQQKVNLTAPTITFHAIEKYKMFSIVFKPVYGIIYKNNKKENRVMRHQEVHKFCDATLKRVLEGLNVKHGYMTPSLGKEDDEYMQLFEKESEEWLKHHDRMSRWEMYVNGRPLGSRREHPE
ncbi:hypothetical protein Tco_1198344 [Tanacetum coccineum]